jgi:hypothetical protein
MHVYGYQLGGEYSNAIRACDEHLERLKGNKGSVPPAMTNSFLNLKANLCLQIRETASANVTLEICEQTTPQNEPSWFNFAFTKLKYLIRTEQYEAAQILLNQMRDHAAYNKLSSIVREEHKVFEAIVHYFVDNKNSTFRFQRLMNEIPELSKDQKGMVINIVLIQILFELRTKNYRDSIPLILDRWETQVKQIRSYENPRIPLFYRMLRSLSICDFKAHLAAGTNAARLKKMEQHVIQYSEIIDYEAAWKIILSRLN